MSMTACRECGQKVSTSAWTCPFCGASAPVPGSNDLRCFRMIGWLIFCVYVMVALGGGC